jgi:hypothetical protein
MIIFRLGQAIAAVPDEATAFSHRDANYIFHPISAWFDPADPQPRLPSRSSARPQARRPRSLVIERVEPAAGIDFGRPVERSLQAPPVYPTTPSLARGRGSEGSPRIGGREPDREQRGPRSG